MNPKDRKSTIIIAIVGVLVVIALMTMRAPNSGRAYSEPTAWSFGDYSEDQVLYDDFGKVIFTKRGSVMVAGDEYYMEQISSNGVAIRPKPTYPIANAEVFTSCDCAMKSGTGSCTSSCTTSVADGKVTGCSGSCSGDQCSGSSCQVYKIEKVKVERMNP